MCRSCVEPGDFNPVIEAVDPDLQPKRAAHLKARGGRYVFGSSPNDPNVQDAMRSNPAPKATLVISAEAWERIFGGNQNNS